MLPVTQFTDFIEQNKLFNRDSKILAAVSGGMDSVLLAHLLKHANFNFGIAHCNFQLRGEESKSDQKFCEQLAADLAVPFYSTCFDTLKFAAAEKISTQMAARQLRYQWFEQVRRQSSYDVIAVAHHQNDAIETILLNLVRGTGIAGLHGILPKNGNLTRPLLFLTRDEIETIIKENEIAFVEDSSNTSTKYTRNKMRLEVIPKLKEMNPGIEQTFKNTLNHFKEMELLLNQRVAELRNELFITVGGDIYLPIDKIKEIEPKRLLIFNLFKEFGFNETSVDDLIQTLGKHAGRVFESATHKIIVDREYLILTARQSLVEPIVIQKSDKTVGFGEYTLAILHDDSPLIVKSNHMATSVDAELLLYPLTLRTWQNGDFFYPLGMKSRKKVSDFFVSQKIPLHEKDKIPLLINKNDEIIWIGGYRLNDRYKVTDKTKKVTIFELTKI
jgi:tRNA(Ile)-lysidine synthase